MLDRLKVMQISGRLDAAEASFLRMRDASPDAVHAWLGLGYCASLRADREAARQAFAQAASVCPDDEAAAIACGKAWSHVGAFDSARDSLARRPATVGQQIALGELEEQGGAHGPALACYQRAAALDPQADQPLRKMIDLHRRRGERVAALHLVDRLAALDPRHEATAWHLRGQVHRTVNDRDGAMEAFRRACDLAPDSEIFAIDLARELRDAARDEEAQVLLAGRPPTWRTLLALGDIALGRRDHEAALRYLAAAQAREPNRPDAWARRAAVEADRGNVDAALASADRIDSLGAEHRLAAMRCRIAVFKVVGDEIAALSVFQQLHALVPGDVGMLAELARQYRMTGNPDAARRMAAKALELDEQNVAALVEAGSQAVASEDRIAVLEFHRRVLERAPDDPASHIRLARLLHDMDRLEESQEVYAQAASQFGHSSQLWSERIRLLRESGLHHEALQEARRAQAFHPAQFDLWLQRFALELTVSPRAEVESCIGCAPVRSRADESQLCLARGSLVRRHQDIQGAIAHLEEAIRLKGTLRRGLLMLCELYLREFATDRAEACFARVKELDAPGNRMRYAAMGERFSHHGMILSAFLMDREATADAAAARTDNSERDLRRLLSLLRKRPAHFPTAIGLIVACRRAGLFERPTADADGPARTPVIPKTIGQFWDKPQISDELLELSGSWRAHNEGYRYDLFNATTARAYLKWHFPPDVAAAFARCTEPAAQADLFRLAFLLREGGVWADMDDRCMVPLSRWIPDDAEACFWEENSGAIGNNFIAAKPGHPIIRRALAMGVEALLRGDQDLIWFLTGPGLITRAFALDMLEDGDQPAARLARIAVIDEFTLHRGVAIGCRTAHKRLGLHWSAVARAGNHPAKASDDRAAF